MLNNAVYALYKCARRQPSAIFYYDIFEIIIIIKSERNVKHKHKHIMSMFGIIHKWHRTTAKLRNGAVRIQSSKNSCVCVCV